MKLFPREEKFYQCFLDQVAVIREASNALYDGVKADNPSTLAQSAAIIDDLEQRGDDIIRDFFTRLNSTFITPLDPEDLHSIATHLDDVIDGIEDTSHRLSAYLVQPIPPEIHELCKIVVSCGNELHKAFEALSKDKPLLDHCIEINFLEKKADDIARNAITGLFLNQKDPIQLLKLKEVYDALESTIDNVEDVADTLRGVIVKNS